MPRVNKGAILGMVHEGWATHLWSRQKAILTDYWVRGEQRLLTSDGDVLPESTDWVSYNGDVFQPPERTDEHRDLESRSSTPWGGLVVTSLAQTVHIDGLRRGKDLDNLKQWDTFEANRWSQLQGPIHRSAIGLSTAYGIAMPAKDPLTGDKMTKLMARSPKRMTAYYDEDSDQWARYVVDGTRVYENGPLGRIATGWLVEVYDAYVVHTISCKGDGRDLKDWTYISYEEHPSPVPPVQRCVNRLDLDGRATGEIEPILPLLRRIDQDMFDRLIVQRFGAWKVRYIAGMVKPGNQSEAALQAVRLAVENLLVSTDNQTKFGTLDATDPNGYIAVNDHDLRILSAITQTPPHHLLGLSSNLQAESLAAAESGLQRKSADFKQNAGEFHEDMARLVGVMEGDKAIAGATDLQVRWRDTESRSLVQAADALGKLAVQLKIPVEMLWEKVPNWTDADSDRAKSLIETGGIDQLLSRIAGDLEAENAAAAAEAAGTGAPGDPSTNPNQQSSGNKN